MTEFSFPESPQPAPPSEPNPPEPLGSSQPSSSQRKRLRLRPSTFWSVRRGIPTWLKWVMPIIGLGLPLLIWSILSYGGFVKAIFLPTPTKVLTTGWALFREDDLIKDILASTMRVLLGFLAAAIVSTPLGLMMGTFHSIERLFNPFVSAVRYMPVAAFMPLIVIWAGIDETAKVLIVFLGIVLYNITMIVDGVKAIPDEVLNAAYTLGANRLVLVSQVIFPAALPSIMNTLRVNIAGAWNFLIIAELIAASEGLGFRILRSQRYLQTDRVLFCILIIGLIGLATDFALKRLTLALTPWAEEGEKA
jgi:NitT/TauT family transport system permease protein